MEMYNNNQQQPFFNNQQPQYQQPYYNQQMYGAPAYMGYGYGNQMPNFPQAESSLTKEEYEKITGKKSQSYMITEVDSINAKCNHRNPMSEAHEIVLQPQSDGSVKCPICGATFNPDNFDTEGLRDANEVVKNAIQNIKTYQGIPKNVLEQYSVMIPMLDKLPIMLDKVRSVVDSIGLNNAYNYNFANDFRATFDMYNTAVNNGNINFCQQWGAYQYPNMGMPQGQYVQPQGQAYPPNMNMGMQGQYVQPQGGQQQGFIPQINPFAQPQGGQQQPQQFPGQPGQQAPVGAQAQPNTQVPPAQQAPVGAQNETVVSKQFQL